MDIRRLEGNGFPYDRIDQPHGRIVDHVFVFVDDPHRQTFRRIHQFLVFRPLQIFQRRRRRLHRHDRIDKNIDLHRRHQYKIHRPHICLTQHRHRRKIQRPCDRHQHFSALIFHHRNKFVLPQERQGHILQKRPVDLQHIHFTIRKTEKLTQRRQSRYLCTITFRDHVIFHRHIQAHTILIDPLHLFALDDLFINVIL